MEDHIKTIREACIRANPEIVNLDFGTEVSGKDGFGIPFKGIYLKSIDNEGRVQIFISKPLEGKNRNNFKGIHAFSVGINTLEILGRPIRLADVLLAIANIDARLKLNRGAKIIRLFGSETIFEWNLLKDSLTEQSPETIEFIAELLK